MVPSPPVSIAQAVASPYDELVATSPQGSVFCTSWWLDAVAPGGWRAHELEENGRVVEAELDDFLELHRRRFARDPQGIERIDAAARERSARTILVARDGDGQARAGGYFVHDDRFTTYLLAATDAEARGAASLVLWEAIKRAAGRGTTVDLR